jgi:small nuclear ribonucleoprotein (snRNP)-like protein
MTVLIIYETVMKRFLTAIMMIAAVVAAFPGSLIAQSGSTAQRDKYERIVRDIGVGDKATVEVKLKDGTKVKGLIRSFNPDSFVVEQEKTHVEQTVAFNDVESAKKPRNGLKPRTWAIIGGAAAAAIIIGVTVLYPVLCDGGAGC